MMYNATYSSTEARFIEEYMNTYTVLSTIDSLNEVVCTIYKTDEGWVLSYNESYNHLTQTYDSITQTYSDLSTIVKMFIYYSIISCRTLVALVDDCRGKVHWYIDSADGQIYHCNHLCQRVTGKLFTYNCSVVFVFDLLQRGMMCGDCLTGNIRALYSLWTAVAPALTRMNDLAVQKGRLQNPSVAKKRTWPFKNEV